MARDVFDRFGSPQDYGWFQKYLLEDELASTRRKYGEYGSKLKAGQDLGGTVGGLIGTYGGPALASWILGGPIGGTANLIASSVGAAAGTGIGQGVGGMGLEAPDYKFGAGEIADMYEQFRTANVTDIMKSGIMTAGTGLSMGVDKYATHVTDVNKATHTAMRDPGNLEMDWGAIMPGGDPFVNVYKGEKMILDPNWKQKKIIDEIEGSTTKGQLIPDPEDTAAKHMIRDEQFYRDLPLGTSRREGEFIAREGDWWKYGIETEPYGTGIFEEQGWIPEEGSQYWDDKYAEYKTGEQVPFSDYYEHLARSGELQPWVGEKQIEYGGFAEWIILGKRHPFGNGYEDPGHPSEESHDAFVEEVIYKLLKEFRE